MWKKLFSDEKQASFLMLCRHKMVRLRPGLLLPLVLLQDVHLDEETFRSFVAIQTFLERVVRHLRHLQSCNQDQLQV